MERRDFLKVALGVAAGAAAFAASLRAAPLMPQPLADDGRLPANPEAKRKSASGNGKTTPSPRFSTTPGNMSRQRH